MKNLLILIPLLLLIASCNDTQNPSGDPSAFNKRKAVPVTLVKAVAKSEVIAIDAVGTAEALRSVTLFPATSDEVVRVEFASGQRVKAGQVLLQLDDRQERLALELAEAELTDARRNLSRFESAGTGSGFTKSQLDEAKIAAEQARIARDQAQIEIDDRRMVAPFDGVVGLTEVEPGDRVSTDTPITTLDDRSNLLVRFTVPEDFLGQVEVGSNVMLSPWTGSLPASTATIVDVDSRINPVTRTMTVRARLSNEDDRFRPGMGFRVELKLIGPEYLQLPELTLQWGGNGAYIWTLDQQSIAHRTSVKLVQRGNGSVLLDADLAPGQAVVMEGVQQMAEGRKVEVIDPLTLDTQETLPARFVE